MREICFDTETTGLYPKEGDRVIEIGAVELNRYNISENFFHQYLNPERDIPEAVVKVHNITNEFVKDKPLFADIADEFIEFIRGARLIAHNAPFDVSFLDIELQRCGKGKLTDYCAEVVDTVELARKLFPQQKNTLDAICNRLGVDLSERDNGHGALVDSRLLAQVYILMRQEQASFDTYEDEPVEQAAVIANARSSGKVIRATEEDLVAHNALLEKVAKSSKGTPHYLMDNETYRALREKERESVNSKSAKVTQFLQELYPERQH